MDDKSSPDTAVAGIRQLIDDKVTAVVGPVNGSVGVIVAPIAQQARIPLVITTASAADVSGDYVFRAGIPQQRYAAAVVGILAKRGVKEVGVIWDQSQASIAGPVWLDTQKPALAKARISVVQDEPVSTTTADFTSQVLRIVRSNPDAVGVLVQGTPNLTIVNLLREAGYRGLVWGQQAMANAFYLSGGKNVYGSLVSVSFAANLGPASSKNFTKRFMQRYNTAPGELAAHGYDATWMAMRAIKQANSTNRAAVQRALARMKTMQGAQGLITFTNLGDATGRGFVVAANNGKFVGVQQ